MKANFKNRLNNRRNRLVRIYDFGNGLDRYTIIYLQPEILKENKKKIYFYLGASENPYHPQGFGLHSDTPDAPLDAGHVVRIGRRNHLGKRISFNELPEKCQKAVIADLKSVCE